MQISNILLFLTHRSLNKEVVAADTVDTAAAAVADGLLVAVVGIKLINNLDPSSVHAYSKQHLLIRSHYADILTQLMTDVLFALLLNLHIYWHYLLFAICYCSANYDLKSNQK